MVVSHGWRLLPNLLCFSSFWLKERLKFLHRYVQGSQGLFGACVCRHCDHGLQLPSFLCLGASWSLITTQFGVLAVIHGFDLMY